MKLQPVAYSGGFLFSMLPRSQRLTSTQFDRAFAQSQNVRHPLVVLRAHFRGDGEEITRAAFVVPKKQGKATARNRTRRRLRERYRLHPLRNSANLVGYDLIFMSTPQTHAATGEALDVALTDVLRRVGKKSGGSPSTAIRNAAVDEKTDTSMAVAEPVATPFVLEEAASSPASPTKPTLPITWLALSLIRFYQRYISPGLPPSCRFEPTCSRYTYDAIERFGLWRGGYLGTMRLCRCHPWQDGGDDPVPHFFPETTPWHQIRNLFSRRRYAPETKK